MTANPVAKLLDSAVLRWQLAVRPHALALDPPQDAAMRATVADVTQWAYDYLGSPHPDLGRKGAICPFVRGTIELDRFHVCARGDVTDSGLRRLRAVVLGGATAYLERFPRAAPKSAFTSLVLAFPRLRESRHALLDTLHDQIKTHMIESRALMCTPFHPQSVKPSTSNPNFPVFRSPFPLFVFRHMDVRDIRFLDHNRRAFQSYHARYAAAFARGDVSDEFGYVSRFKEACERFNVRAAADAPRGTQ